MEVNILFTRGGVDGGVCVRERGGKGSLTHHQSEIDGGSADLMGVQRQVTIPPEAVGTHIVPPRPPRVLRELCCRSKKNEEEGELGQGVGEHRQMPCGFFFFARLTFGFRAALVDDSFFFLI